MLSINGPTMVLVGLLTGVFLLLYGVRLVSDSVQQFIRERLQQVLPSLSKNPLAVFGIGVVATGLLQSSSAMSSLLVELVNTDILPLNMAIVVLLGSNVGSTLVVQLLALHVTDYAFEIVGVATVVALFTHRTAYRKFGLALFAFSLVLSGLAIIKLASDPIANAPVTAMVLRQLADSPLVLAIIGAALAMLLNSSAAAIGLVLPLAATRALSPTSALALMLGANVGTTLLSMFVSLSARSLAGRRLAFIHLGTKLLGATILLLFLQPLSVLLSQTGLGSATQVALTHLAFSLALAVIFVPLSDLVARLMERLLSEKTQLTAEFFVQHILDPQALATPAVAYGLATRETLRMADIVTNMLELGMRSFENQPDAIQAHLAAMDDQLDNLEADIKDYLIRLDEEVMTTTLLTIVDDLEVIGDVINQQFMSLAYRRARHNTQFSSEGWKELLFYHQQIAGALQQVFAALATHNPMLVTDFLSRKQELKQLKHNLRLNHIHRLRVGIENDITSSAIHLDLLHAMSTILARIANVADTLQHIPVNRYVLSEEIPVNAYVLSEDTPVNAYLFSDEVIRDSHPLISTGQFIGVRGRAVSHGE